MQVLALYASPREESFSSKLHDCFLEPFSRRGVRIIRLWIHDLNIEPCIACGHCENNDECVFHDDMDRIYQLLQNSEILSISSPVYFSSPPGPLKTLIDRCQTIWEDPMGSQFRRKGRFQRALFMATAGSPPYRNMFIPSKIIMKHFFRIIGATWNENDFILVPDTDKISKIDEFTCARASKLALKYLDETEGES